MKGGIPTIEESGATKVYPWITNIAENKHCLTCKWCNSSQSCNYIVKTSDIKSRLEVMSYSYRINDYYGNENYPLCMFQGPNAKAHFLDQLKNDSEMLHEKLMKNVEINLTVQEKDNFKSASNCHICQDKFPNPNDFNYKSKQKVRNHQYFTGLTSAYHVINATSFKNSILLS